MANIASDKKELNWAVLGTGVIANQMASALADMGRQLYGVANRTYEKAVTFAEKYGVQKVFPTYEAVLMIRKWMWSTLPRRTTPIIRI